MIRCGLVVEQLKVRIVNNLKRMRDLTLGFDTSITWKFHFSALNIKESVFRYMYRSSKNHNKEIGMIKVNEKLK